LGFVPRNDELDLRVLVANPPMSKEHKKALIVTIIVFVLIIFVTFFRNGTSW
jgi:hypothetical protein